MPESFFEKWGVRAFIGSAVLFKLAGWVAQLVYEGSSGSLDHRRVLWWAVLGAASLPLVCVCTVGVLFAVIDRRRQNAQGPSRPAPIHVGRQRRP